MIALSGLRQHIEETVKSHGHEFFENPKDVYTGYQLTPKESDELRFDVIVGSTCLSSIVADYYHDSTELFDHANGFGAQALYIVFQNGAGEDNILNFRHDLEDRITEEILEPGNLGVITGGATGTEYSYIDLFVYDFPAFAMKVRALLKEYSQFSFYISDFIRNGHILQLTEADSDVIPYTKENAEAFFKQIEDWNDNDRYTKCIRALETIPADEMDYESTMLLVRAYENYAILGDNNEEPEIEECDRALNKALELLESVRETGENKARWNMRMAYAYQYLTGQKEKAVAYAEKWAELDPEDENAKLVIKECKRDILRQQRKMKRKNSSKVPHDNTPFADFDFSNFWDDDDYARKNYISDIPSDKLIAEIEEELGYKLPASYIWLMKQHNGGIPFNTCFPSDSPTSWAEDHIAITGIFGIGREKDYSLCGGLGSKFMIDEWGYPEIGVAICDCPSAGHDMIFLDYRKCGPQGEPSVVHIDQECDYKITPLADNFEEFIRGLENEEEYEYDEDNE